MNQITRKLAQLLLLTLLIQSSVLENGIIDDSRDYDLVDEEEPEMVEETEHLIPDINCLTQKHPNFFGFPEKETTPFIQPKSLNVDIDPFMTFLDAKLEEKKIDDYILEIEEVNEYFDIEEDKFIPLRKILDECSELPEKFELRIKELNYFYCAVVWKHGFDVFTQQLDDQKAFKKGFFKIVEHTIGEIFDYKTYMHTLQITNFTLHAWNEFYKNLLDFNDINVHYESYMAETIVSIKDNNFFFNKQKFLDQNFFFRFYENYVDILRALNKAYFYFDIKGEYLLEKANLLAHRFEKLFVDQLYESLFYMLMRRDEKFLELLEDYMIHNGSFKEIMMAEIEESKDLFVTYITQIIEQENSFNLADALKDAEKEEELEHEEELEGEMQEPTRYPMENTELVQFQEDDGKDDTRKLIKKSPDEILQDAIHAAKNEEANAEATRHFAEDSKIGGDKFVHEPEHIEGRLLEEETGGDTGGDGGEGESGEGESNEGEGDGENEDEEGEFDLPAQNDISKPQEFFKRIDFMKKPLDVAAARMRLKDYFHMVEERVKKYYGVFANVYLIEICNGYMQTELPSIRNIICLIMQRETSILIQQKYDNSKVKRFLERYMAFIAFNFFTFFKKLQDNGDLIEISVLTLFYGEKLFNGIKLAVVSLNNLALHFEGEYKEYFEDRLRDIFMPLINLFKSTLVTSFYEYENDLNPNRIDEFDITVEKMKEIFMPKFRPIFEQRIMSNVIDKLNLFDLEEQYKDYVNSMNLLSYDKIKEKFEFFSKKDGVEISSEGPPSKCEQVHLRDMVKMSKKLKAVVDKEGGEEEGGEGDESSEEDLIEEGECAKQWKMYDDAFHNVFFSTATSTIYLKEKSKSNDPEENIYREAIATELTKVVNGFIAPRMKEMLDHFDGDIRSSLEKCGIIFNYSRIKCFSIFGNENCDNVPGTFYFTRNCPPGYTKFNGRLGCEFNCAAVELVESGEFCAKPQGQEKATDCPAGTFESEDGLKCMKPARKYFSYIFNPFNNKL